MSEPVEPAAGMAAMEGSRTGALREVVLVTGISGSGKSVALHALEDAGFFCVDNLPPELLRDFLRLEQERLDRRVAIAVDVRSADSLPYLLDLLQQLGNEGVSIRVVFLDASTDALVRRFSETRRPHPLSEHDPNSTLARRKSDQAIDSRRALVDAIELERELLADLREVATVIDTSQLRPAQLRIWVRDMLRAAGNRLTLVFESFAFKHGVPLDADYVFVNSRLKKPRRSSSRLRCTSTRPANGVGISANDAMSGLMPQLRSGGRRSARGKPHACRRRDATPDATRPSFPAPAPGSSAAPIAVPCLRASCRV